MNAATLSILTPANPGAIGVLLLQASDAATLEQIASSVGISVPAVGSLRLASIADVDRGVVSRWTPATLHLMPHAGPAVIQEIVHRLHAVGVKLARPESVDPRALYPEADDEVEAAMLWALSRAVSPLAIDLLLEQPRLWRTPGARSDPARDRLLNRLIDPPMVAAIGPPNVGKSSLCNALAGRSVAVVADEAGTTRDHVGVAIEVGGLTIRYIDTPGMTAVGPRSGAPSEEADAVEITRHVLASADLVLRCGDATSSPLPLPPGCLPRASVLTIATRADLSRAAFAHDLSVSAATGDGIPRLATLIREALVPTSALNSGHPWKFWGAPA